MNPNARLYLSGSKVKESLYVTVSRRLTIMNLYLSNPSETTNGKTCVGTFYLLTDISIFDNSII